MLLIYWYGETAKTTWSSPGHVLDVLPLLLPQPCPCFHSVWHVCAMFQAMKQTLNICSWSHDFILKTFRFVNGSLNVPNMLWHLCSANLANAPIHPIARTHMHTYAQTHPELHVSCMFPLPSVLSPECSCCCHSNSRIVTDYGLLLWPIGAKKCCLPTDS